MDDSFYDHTKTPIQDHCGIFMNTVKICWHCNGCDHIFFTM